MPSPLGFFIRTDGSLRAGWRVVLFLTVNGLIEGVGKNLAQKSGFSALDAWQLQFWTSIALSVLATWLFLFLEGRPLASIGLRFGRRWGRQFLAGLALGFLFMVSVALAIRGFNGFHWVMSGEGGLPSLATGAWLFLAVALREELLYRGYAFQRLLDGTGEWLALGLASLYFAYAHGNNPGVAGSVGLLASLNIALAGVLLGLAYLKTRSLAMPMGLHLAWNWTQGSLLGFGVSGLNLGSMLKPVFQDQPVWLTGGAFGLEASLLCALFSSLAIAGLVLWKPGDEAGSVSS